MNHKDTLISKLDTRQAITAVIGLGYVGLPLAIEFAETGFSVIGVDISEKKVDLINQGISYIPDIPTERLKPLVESGKIRATTHYSELSTVDTINICVPTPLTKTKDPDMSFIINSIDEIVKICHEGMLIILESTTYPGTTREIILPRIEATGLVAGESVFIAFSPERIDPGNKTYTVHNTPKVVGGVTPHCSEVAHKLYTSAIEQVVTVSSPTTAEMVKLLENTFRAVNIGLVNEVAMMCDKLQIDAWEVIEAAATKPFGFMPFFPGPGLGGHCIPVDPHYLSWKLKTLNYNARFIELASEINTAMPLYVLDKISNALNDDGKPVKNSKIVVLGVAYKRDVDDVRESPALDIIELLRQKGGDVCYNDPHVPSIRLIDDKTMQNSEYSDALLKQADCVVIVTDHTSYDWQHILDTSRLVVDTRHVTAPFTGTARVVSL
ncbi:MAG: nucleotide sugar dehydrogenase [Aggregatilineales bacterium]